jgi:hypothetical protein
MRMSGGTVASGRGVDIGQGESLGIATEPGSRTAFGIVGVLSTERTLGMALGMGGTLARGGTVGIGTRLVVGSTSGRGTITGSSSGELTCGSVGTAEDRGGTGAAASGVRGDAVHATDALSATTTKSRIPHLPAQRTSKSLASRPRQTVNRREPRCKVHRPV